MVKPGEPGPMGTCTRMQNPSSGAALAAELVAIEPALTSAAMAIGMAMNRRMRTSVLCGLRRCTDDNPSELLRPFSPSLSMSHLHCGGRESHASLEESNGRVMAEQGVRHRGCELETAGRRRVAYPCFGRQGSLCEQR